MSTKNKVNKKLIDKINLKEICFEKCKKGRHMMSIVTFTKSSEDLYFNSLMIKKLGITDWKCVMVGIDPKSKIIILKKSDPEEYGTVKVVVRQSCYMVSVKHIMPKFSNFPKKFFAECENNMILLEELKE